jgi:hypothetical protein
MMKVVSAKASCTAPLTVPNLATGHGSDISQPSQPLTTCLPKMHLNVILPSTSGSSKLTFYKLSSVCVFPRQSHAPHNNSRLRTSSWRETFSLEVKCNVLNSYRIRGIYVLLWTVHATNTGLGKDNKSV